MIYPLTAGFMCNVCFMAALRGNAPLAAWSGIGMCYLIYMSFKWANETVK